MRKAQVQASFEAFSQEYFYAATAIHVSGGIKRPNVMFQLGASGSTTAPFAGKSSKPKPATCSHSAPRKRSSPILAKWKR